MDTQKELAKAFALGEILSKRSVVSLLIGSVLIHAIMFSMATYWFTSMIKSEIQFNRTMLERVVLAIEKLNRVQ